MTVSFSEKIEKKAGNNLERGFSNLECDILNYTTSIQRGCGCYNTSFLLPRKVQLLNSDHFFTSQHERDQNTSWHWHGHPNWFVQKQQDRCPDWQTGQLVDATTTTMSETAPFPLHSLFARTPRPSIFIDQLLFETRAFAAWNSLKRLAPRGPDRPGSGHRHRNRKQ